MSIIEKEDLDFLEKVTIGEENNHKETMEKLDNSVKNLDFEFSESEFKLFKMEKSRFIHQKEARHNKR